ncbi:hypothetical protein GLOIN_2v583658 [Rhizophagus irregularis DAOM 181602=DAOM 197198]|nr:hypothetical protein GLOIN_2v583658 [Rhizophagus irregularis DAOM 181602=DAOM 197198]
MVLGIDELNNFIGGIMCKPPTNIYFIPILAGTIEGYIKNCLSGSMHEPLFLPLHKENLKKLQLKKRKI